MEAWNVLVASFEEHAERAAALASQLEADWEGSRPLTLRTTAIEALEPDTFDGVDAAVLDVLGAPDLRPVRYLASEIEEQGTPVIVLTGSDPSRPRMLAVDPSDPHAIATMLRGLLHRGDEVQRLRQELLIAQRCHGGIHGEITRIHEELQLAAMMQREFLPAAMPTVLGVEFAALWRPAHYVSGDIYTVMPLDEEHVAVFLADCVGHGVPAALMTMLICRSLSTAMTQVPGGDFAEPAEVLTRLNDDLVRRQGDSTRFATAVYGIVNCRSRELRLAGAGHPPPLVVRDGHPDRDLPTSGGLLGIFEGAEFDQVATHLEEDERLLIYSDGFEQAFPEAGTDAYAQRLPNGQYRIEFSQLGGEGSAPAMVERVARRLNDQQGSLHQADDLTLVCVRAGAPAAAQPVPEPENASVLRR